jgi:hypothetical protein
MSRGRQDVSRKHLNIFKKHVVKNLDPRAILKTNNNQRGETRQDNHAGRHNERQIE